MKKSILTHAGVFLVALSIGSAASNQPQLKEVVKEVPKEVIKEVPKVVFKTPPSCKGAIELDNAIFLNVGQAFGSLDFQRAIDYMDSVSDERTSKALACLAN